jgi:hypothetical protein
MPRDYPPRAIDMTGQRYGRLVAVKHVGRNDRGIALWLCKCDCGNDHTTSRRNLLHKISPTLSCGCLRNERSKAALDLLAAKKEA